MCEDITKLEHCLFVVTGNRPSKPRGGFCYGHVLPKMLCPAHAQVHIRGIYERVWKLLGKPRGLTCRVWLNSGRPTRDIKYSSHFIFKFYINRDTSVLELFHVVVFQQKDSPCWPRQSSLKLLACGRKIHNDVHIDTYYCKPELISWR